MKKLLKCLGAVAVFAALGTISACKKSFDQPPSPTDPAVVANSTIATLKSIHTTSGAYDVISSDIIISGIVTANDKGGNLYKQIFIQDTTGAMQILLEANSVYSTFPVGRKVFVRCKGLCLSDYHGNMELGILANVAGVPSIQGILSGSIGNYVLGGSLDNPVTPLLVTSSQLGTGMQDRYINALVKLENYEFTTTDTTRTYSDTSAYKSTVNDTIQNCDGSSSRLLVRTSSYANFAALNLPRGNGTITSIYTIYKSYPTAVGEKQLLVRDTSDVQFYNPRCGSTPPPAGSRITIAQLRALYTGSNIKLPASLSIGGVVISDAVNKNISSGSVIIQEGNAGISIYFGSTIGYNVGDSVIINVSSDSLLNYHGSLEVKTAFGTTQPPAVATGRLITPQVKTISEINSALATSLGAASNIEFTLLKIADATASGGTTYAGTGNRTLTDASGSMTLYTSSSALFGTSPLPTTPQTWTGYANTYNSTKEFQVRNLSDVQ